MSKLLHNFNNINTSEKAYVVGLIASDGTVEYPYRVRINLHRQDVFLLKKIKFWGFPDSKLHFSSDNTVRLSVNSKEFVSQLLVHNLTPNKSIYLRPPNSIPCQFVKDFIRGYFDGDGSVSYGNKMSTLQVRIVSGSFEILDYIFRASDVYGLGNSEIYESTDQRNGSILYQLCWNSHSGVDFLTWIYSDSPHFYLQRKYDIFREVQDLSFHHRHSSSCREWSKNELEILKSEFLLVKNAEKLLSKLPGRSITAIRAKALDLGIKRHKGK